MNTMEAICARKSVRTYTGKQCKHVHVCAFGGFSTRQNAC